MTHEQGTRVRCCRAAIPGLPATATDTIPPGSAFLRSLVIFGIIVLSSCVGTVDDYSKAALAFSETATADTIDNLRRKHDLEAAAYAAAYCGQPRIGAVARRYTDPEVLKRRTEICRDERAIGFGR